MDAAPRDRMQDGEETDLVWSKESPTLAVCTVQPSNKRLERTCAQPACLLRTSVAQAAQPRVVMRTGGCPLWSGHR